MAFGGGVSLWWFVLAIGLIVAAFPILWQFLGEYQQNRFLILVDDTIDPMGINERYHSMMNLRSLTGGGLTGQGCSAATVPRAAACSPSTRTIFSRPWARSWASWGALRS